ncbi:MAG: TIGR03752 family integrating conjugative element protein, partial [Steroidobacteraceae bacterium]
MKTNGLLKWLLIPVLVLGVWVGVKLTSHHPTTPPPRGATGQPLTPAEMADLGIPADTPRDTVATLVGQVKHLRGELDTALHDNRDQKAENNTLRQQLSDIDARVQAALQSQADHWQRESAQAASDARNELNTQGQIQILEQKIDGLTGKGGDEDLPIGLGLREGDRPALTGPSIQWIAPVGPPANSKSASPAAATSKDPFQFSTAFGSGDSDGSPSESGSGNARSETVARSVKAATRTPIPVYTVPANSTLMGSVAMTALIGR